MILSNRLLKIIDIVFWALWCAYFIFRLQYPKNYPPLAVYDIVLMILTIIDYIIIRMKKIYAAFQKDTLLQVIRISLFFIPIVYSVICIIL
jgi:hypothetical protein